MCCFEDSQLQVLPFWNRKRDLEVNLHFFGSICIGEAEVWVAIRPVDGFAVRAATGLSPTCSGMIMLRARGRWRHFAAGGGQGWQPTGGGQGRRPTTGTAAIQMRRRAATGGGPWRLPAAAGGGQSRGLRNAAASKGPLPMARSGWFVWLARWKLLARLARNRLTSVAFSARA